jgi:hypothetical protein
VLAALRRHGRARVTCRAALACLRALARDAGLAARAAEARRGAGAGAGADADDLWAQLRSALRRFPRDGALLEHAAGALASLAGADGNGSNDGNGSKDGLAVALVDGLLMHPRAAGAQARGCAALAALAAQRAELRTAIAAAGGVGVPPPPPSLPY